jgi:hypothetical protein
MVGVVDKLGFVDVNVLDAVAFQAGGPCGFKPALALHKAFCPGHAATPASLSTLLPASVPSSLCNAAASELPPSSKVPSLPESSGAPTDESMFEPPSLGPPFAVAPPSRGVGSFTNGPHADAAKIEEARRAAPRITASLRMGRHGPDQVGGGGGGGGGGGTGKSIGSHCGV